MKKWQKTRNYRRIKDNNGNIIANIITVDGQDVAVSDEVFAAYSSMDRQERYQEEMLTAHPQVSLQLLEAHDVPLDLYLKKHEPSAEEQLFVQEERLELMERKRRLDAARALLSEEEQQLLQALFFDGISAREYAKLLGVYHRTILYRRDKLLKKLHHMILN